MLAFQPFYPGILPSNEHLVSMVRVCWLLNVDRLQLKNRKSSKRNGNRLREGSGGINVRISVPTTWVPMSSGSLYSFPHGEGSLAVYLYLLVTPIFLISKMGVQRKAKRAYRILLAHLLSRAGCPTETSHQSYVPG